MEDFWGVLSIWEDYAAVKDDFSKAIKLIFNIVSTLQSFFDGH